MSPLRDDQVRIRAAKARLREAEEAFRRGRNRLAARQAALERARRRGREGEAESRRLEAEVRGLTEESERRAARWSAVRGEVRDDVRGVPGLATPQRLVEELDDRIPVLLLPVRVETRFMSAGGGRELWVRIFPDDIAVHTHEPALTPDEVRAGRTFWLEIWGVTREADGEAASRREQGAWRALTAVTGATRAAWAAARTRPASLDVASADALAFPEIDPDELTSEAWSRAPHTRVMPDRFVVMTFAGGERIHEVVGEPVPDPLVLGPDPQATGGDLHQAEGELVASPDVAWIFSFEEAVRVGMGIRIPLGGAAATGGFDRVLVLGLRLTADAADGARLVEELFDNHRFAPDGMSGLPQGTPTNNADAQGAGVSRAEADVSLELALGPPLFEPTDDAAAKTDGQRVAEALGIDVRPLQHLRFADRRDAGEAQAMNAALWPATWGYFLDELLGLPLDGIAATRAFFTESVTGRGPLPAIRVGTQPYGILPTSAFPRWEWSPETEGRDLGFLRTLQRVLRKVDEQWTQLASSVARAGGPGDPFHTLLEMLGLEATSVARFRRRAVGPEYVWNYQVLGSGGRSAQVVQQDRAEQARALIAELGFELPERPKLFELAFFTGHDEIADPFVADVESAEKERWSETAGVAARYRLPAEAALGNYIGWLLRSAADDVKAEAFRDANDQPLPVPRALLYRLLRHALLLAYHDAALRIYASRQVVASRARREVELPNVRSERTVTRWEFLEARVRDVAPDLGPENLSMLERLRRPGLPASGDTAPLEAVRAGLAALETLPTARLERLFAEHLDLCGYRLDAWQTGLFARRLARQRFPSAGGFAARVRGVHVGAYGWLEDLRPAPAPRPVDPGDVPESLREPDKGPIVEEPGHGGFIHGPSPSHAVAAAVLRNAYLTHAAADRPGPMAVNLSSERVRRALAFLDGIRSGHELGALLGYQFERGLQDHHPGLGLAQYVPEFRRRYPLVADKVTPDAEGGTVEAKAARNVFDGYTLVEEAFLKAPPRTYPYDVAGLPADPDSDAARAIREEVERMAEALDAVADLALAEGVYQVTQGNHERGAAMLKILTEGGNPPEPEIARTPRSGTAATHRVALHVEPGGVLPAAWPGTPTPRAAVESGLNRWLGRIVGPPGAIRCIVSTTRPPARDATLTFADLGLQPIDLVYLIGDEVDAQGGERGSGDDTTDLAARLAYAYRRRRRAEDGLADVGDVRIELMRRDPTWAATDRTFFEMLPLLRGLRDLCAGCRPLGADDYALPSEATTDPAEDPNPKGYDEMELRERFDVALGALEDAVGALTDAVADAELSMSDTTVERLRDTLRALADFGVPGAFPRDAVGAPFVAGDGLLAQARSARDLARQRRDRARALVELSALTLEEQARLTVEDRVEICRRATREVLGSAFNLIPRFRLKSPAEAAAALAFREAAPPAGLLRFAGDPLVVDEWLAGVARVRPRMAGLETTCTLAAVVRDAELWLKPLQLPFRSTDHWIAVEYPADFQPAHAYLSLVQVLPAATFDVGVDQSGFLVDEWTETIPRRTETTGLAVHYDQPSSEPPQVLLLAITPKETGRWRWDDLVAILHDTLDRARKRAVEPDHLARTAYGHLLPAVMTAVGSHPLATISADLVHLTATAATAAPGPGGGG